MRPRNQRGSGPIGQARTTDDPRDPRNRRSAAVSASNISTASFVAPTFLASVPVATSGITDPAAIAAINGLIQRVAVLEASHNDLMDKMRDVRQLEKTP